MLFLHLLRFWCKPILGQDILLLFVFSSYSQELVEENVFKVGDITVSLCKSQFVETDQGFCEASSEIKLTQGSEKLYSNVICSAELTGVKLLNKSYLTVVEHYSSPVGWSQFYVFDLCKMQLVLTKKLQESQGLSWEEFIDFSSEFKTKYIEKITPLE